ncbi:hypothetical protein GW17_00061704, partial [Ensete ventricosum]
CGGKYRCLCTERGEEEGKQDVQLMAERVAVEASIVASAQSVERKRGSRTCSSWLKGLLWRQVSLPLHRAWR